jgi:hypothetical protein
MALESSTYINGLVASNPTSSDNISDGDNHIRLLKSTIKATFPNVTGAVSGTHTAINSAVTAANAATNANTASTIVKRDASGNFSAGTVTAALSGNATTASTLQTARTIGGVSFNGSANINLPGVNTAGSQSTTGNAATASRWASARTITLGQDLSGSVSIRGDANVTLNATVADDSHNHIISNVDGLQAALNGKVDDSQVLTNVPSGAVFTDTNTTYSVGNGGLTEINFTSALNSKLAGIESGAKGDQTATEIRSLLTTVDGSGSGIDADKVDGYNIVFNQAGTASDTIYFRT